MNFWPLSQVHTKSSTNSNITTWTHSQPTIALDKIQSNEQLLNIHAHQIHSYFDGKPISQVEGSADISLSRSDESVSLKSEVAIEQLVPDGDIKSVESVEENTRFFSQNNDIEHKSQLPTTVTDQSISLVSNYEELTVKVPETSIELGNENNLLIIPELVSDDIETNVLQTIDVPVEECVQRSPLEYNGHYKRTVCGQYSLFEDKAEPLELESEDEEILIINEGDNEDTLLHETGSQSIQNRNENLALVNGNDNECVCSPLDETEPQSAQHENENIILSNKPSIETECQSFQNENVSKKELSSEAEHQTLKNNVGVKEDINPKDQLSETESQSYENRNVTNEVTNSPQDSEISSDLKLDILSSFRSTASNSSKTPELFSFSQPLPLLTKAQLIEMLDRDLHDQLPTYSLPSVFSQSSPLTSSPPSKRVKSIDQVKEPSHPEEFSNDGYDTVNQNLPTESAQEYAIVPQHCQNKNINNDKNDPSGSSSLDIANVPNCDDTTHSNDTTVIVPSIPTKTTASIITTHSHPEQSCSTSLYENFIESSITSLVESDLPPTLKTALKINPTWSHRVFHNVFHFDPVEPTRLNLSRPKLRLGLSKKETCSSLHHSSTIYH